MNDDFTDSGYDGYDSALDGDLDDDFTNGSSNGYAPDKSDNSTLSGDLNDDFTDSGYDGYDSDNNALSSFNSSNSNAHNTEEAVINNSMPENYDNTNVTGQDLVDLSEKAVTASAAYTSENPIATATATGAYLNKSDQIPDAPDSGYQNNNSHKLQKMAENSEFQHRKLPSSDSGKSYDRSKNKKLKPVSKESQTGRIGDQD